MTLFVDLTQAETTSDTDEILVKQGLTYRRVKLTDVKVGEASEVPSSLSVTGDSATLTQTGEEVQSLLDQVGNEANTRTTFTQLATNIATNGVVSLSQDWDAFEEIIIEYSPTLVGDFRNQNVFYTEIIAPSDSTTEFEYSLNSINTNATRTIFNFRGTNRNELYMDFVGDDDSIVTVYGRYLK